MTRPQVASRSEVARGLRAIVCAAAPRRGSLLYSVKASVVLFFALLMQASAGELSLNGEWRLDYFPQPARGAVRSLDIPPHESVVATVPGCCELELVKRGILPTPEVGLNAIAFRKYEGYQWLYSRTFAARACDGADGSRAELVFGGIDTLADVFLNGRKIGESENMLIERRFDVTGMLLDGTNTVQVLIRSAFLEAGKHTVGELGYHQLQADREPIRKAAYMGGWDIFPRLYVAGLWRDVKVDYLPPVRLENVVWLFGDIDVGKRTANLKVQFRCVGPMDIFMLNHRVRITLRRKGEVRLSGERLLVGMQMQCRFVGEDGLSNADFWWPRDLGEPALYDGTVEVVDEKGAVLATDTRKVGVRSIKLINEDIEPAKGRKGEFMFYVNGERCFVRGANWVPLDAFPCRQRARLPETLAMLEDLNCNMVRVWGGGVYEPHEFFDWCDEHGVMVWQDFMMACTAYPQSNAYAAIIEEEVRQVAIELRNHASLALWCGNNENDHAIYGRSFPEHRRDPNEDRLSRSTIPRVLWEFDATRPYLPSSPFWSTAAFRKEALKPEDHLWGNRDFHKTDYLTNNPAIFVSETGFHGCPGRASLEKMMTASCLYPWTAVTNGGQDPVKDFIFNDEWQYKASNPLLNRDDKWGSRRNSNMTRQVKALLGAVPRDLNDFADASQIAQSEGLKTLIETFRARKFNGKNGLIWWNLRDGWPILSDAVVDGFNCRKRAYWTVKNVQQAQLVLVADDHAVIAVNDTREPVCGRVDITDRTTGEKVFKRKYEVPANSSVMIGTVPWQGRGVLDIDYCQGGRSQYNWFIYGDFPFSMDEMRRFSDESLSRIK